MVLAGACGPGADPTTPTDAAREGAVARDGASSDAPAPPRDATVSACDASAPDACGPTCGDGRCDPPSEDSTSCPADCAGTMPCGSESQFCCDGGTCNAGFVCVRELCRAEAPACTIGEGLTCVPGATGPDCCADGRMCGMFNATEYGCCRAAGQPCGRNEGCCGANDYCVGGVCTPR